MLRNAIASVLLVISGVLAALLVVGGIFVGAGIMYLGAGIWALGGALFGLAYLLVTSQPWRIKRFGLAAVLINVGAFGWLMLQLPK